MHKSLVDTRWTRFKLLIRGLLFYNTIYWRRASDGLKSPKLTPEQRRQLAPPKNFDVIKPRVKPRAHLDDVRRQQMIEELSRLRAKMPAPLAHKLPGSESAPAGPSAPGQAALGNAASRPVAPASGPPANPHRTIRPQLDGVVRRRRHRSSRHGDAKASAPGLIARLLGKKKE